MVRRTIALSAIAILLQFGIQQSAHAQYYPASQGQFAPSAVAYQMPAQPVMYGGSGYVSQPAYCPPGHQQVDQGSYGLTGLQAGQQYPILNAPLYPSPQPNVPVQTGITAITNPAFAPHEMTYPHKYKALYPPFYYKVKGGWIWTPFGIHSYDKWKLKGTEVNVKYRSSFNLLNPYVPPLIK